MTTTESEVRSGIAPGSVVVVRDEEWLVTATEETTDGLLVHAQGLGELVRDTSASFYASLDAIEALDPAAARLVADDSPRYRKTRLWLESTFRKTPVPLGDPSLTISTHALADPLSYQQSAVRQALDPANLRPRILLADAVGLGKTLEIGMILSELVRRGRGDRILIVTPRHVLEQMQHEMWTRFALPFVRLDSAGIQRVRQKLPATRNPFTFYRRVIISIDTLKSDRYAASLRKQFLGRGGDRRIAQPVEPAGRDDEFDQRLRSLAGGGTGCNLGTKGVDRMVGTKGGWWTSGSSARWSSRWMAGRLLSGVPSSVPC